MPEARPIIVTGMHRSGTSLSASLLQAAGVSVGERLMEAGPSNPAGFFEDLDFVELQRAALVELGFHQDGWSAEPIDSIPAELDREARRLVADRKAQRVWGWKDPRTTLFLPYWAALLPEARYVFLYRSPWEAVESLRRRGDTSILADPSRGIEAWISYNSILLGFMESLPGQCLLFDCEAVLQYPGEFVRAVADHLGVELQRPDPALVQRTALTVHRGEGVAGRGAPWLCPRPFALLRSLRALAQPLGRAEGAGTSAHPAGGSPDRADPASISWLLFDEDFYRAMNPGVVAPGQGPLEHFLARGAAEGRDPSPWFDVRFYLESYPDVARSGMNPLEHYVRFGAGEGRDPSPWFVTSFYLNRYPDVARSGMNPLLHFARYGSLEGRQPNEWFVATAYRQAHPAVAVAGADPFLHYVHIGRARGHLLQPAAERVAAGAGLVPAMGRDSQDREADEVRRTVPGSELAPGWGATSAGRGTLPRVVALYEIPGGARPLGCQAHRGAVEAWRRVLQAPPVYPGHHQPRYPAELGPYEVAAPATLAHQMIQAASHGISAFCLRWGRGGAETVERLCALGSPELQFCFLWEGTGPDDPEDARDRLWRLLGHPSCLKVDGRPVLLVGGPSAEQEALRLNEEPLHGRGISKACLVRVGGASGPAAGPGHPFQARVEPSVREIGVPVPAPTGPLSRPFEGTFFGYRETLARHLSRQPPGHQVFSRVAVGWDDTPERPVDGTIFLGASPGAYQAWLELALEQSRERGAGLVFVDGWNRWSRGAVLEPDERWGHAWLQATKRALERAGR